MATSKNRKRRRCNKEHKVMLRTELDAMIALADSQRRDKDVIRYYPCGDHFHLTSQEKRGEEDAEVS